MEINFCKFDLNCANIVDKDYIKYKLRYYKNKEEGKLPIDIQIILASRAYQNKRSYKNLIYKGTKLIDYCHKNNIIYKKIAYRCRYFIKCGNQFSDLNELQISKFIDDYYCREEVSNLKSIFEYLETCNSREYKNICRILNINYKKIQKLKYKNNISLKSLIYICWYSYDNIDNDGIYISQKRLTQIIKGDQLQLNDLYGIYKSGNHSYLDKILDYEKSYLMSFVMRMIREYNFKVSPLDYGDLFSEANIILTNCINRNVFNHIGRIIRYIEKSVTKQILKYLIKNYSVKTTLIDNVITYQEKWDY
ncbi:MAG: hypothetical protein V8Q75_05115 [Bacilli bacterium]